MVLPAMRSIVRRRAFCWFAPFANGLAIARPARARRAPHHEGGHRGDMDREFLSDLFSHFGPVTMRRMFTGYGISADGTNFALALRAGLYFRADEMTNPRFEAEGSAPFSYKTRA